MHCITIASFTTFFSVDYLLRKGTSIVYNVVFCCVVIVYNAVFSFVRRSGEKRLPSKLGHKPAGCDTLRRSQALVINRSMQKTVYSYGEISLCANDNILLLMIIIYLFPFMVLYLLYHLL